MYQVFYHKLVIKDDFKQLNTDEKKKIVKAIRNKLTVDPENFGKPLSGNLKGYFRLRVDFFRVIYKIKKEEIIVLVVKIGLRKNLKAYLQAAKRLNL